MSSQRDRRSLERVVKTLPTDWHPYGFVHRGDNARQEWEDCSCGCRWWQPLEGPSPDWGVCLNPDGPRAGLLTFEHQGGYRCFEEADPE